MQHIITWHVCEICGCPPKYESALLCGQFQQLWVAENLDFRPLDLASESGGPLGHEHAPQNYTCW